MDEIPQCALPHSDMHVLELVTVEAHDDVRLCEVEGMIPVTTDASVTQVLVVSTTLWHSDEHIDVHEVVNVDSSAFITDESDVPINTITDMTVASVDLPQSFKTALDDDVSAMVQQVGPGSTTCPALDAIVSSLNARVAGMQHSNPRIQQDLDLWQRIKEYDRHSAETPFVLVLSKKQNQMLKKRNSMGSRLTVPAPWANLRRLPNDYIFLECSRNW
jgi:hypothetical protein